MSNPVDRVDFLVAGVQKGGTTALFEYLRAHPSLNLAPEKEVHFFDQDELDWSKPDYGAYHARFAAAGPGRLSGEATPIYIYWPECLARIRAYNPAMKIILLFRDPVARAWSQWRMELARGAETEPFSWCIREGRSRLALGDRPGHHRVYSYVERGFYAAQMDRLAALFPPGQVLSLRSTDLDRDPNAVLRRVCGFLEVPPPPPVAPKRVHVTAPAPLEAGLSMDDRRYLRSLYEADDRRFRTSLGLALEAEY